MTRIDKNSGSLIGLAIRIGSDPKAIAFGEGGVWVANYDDSTVARIDAASGRVTGEPIYLGPNEIGPDAIAVGLGSVWVANGVTNCVTRINAKSGKVTLSDFLIRPTDTPAVGSTPSDKRLDLLAFRAHRQ